MSDTPQTSTSPSAAERVFPPWSVGRIVFWMSAFQGISILGGALIGLAAVSINIWLGRDVDASVVEISKFAVRLIYGPTALILILFCTKRAGFSLDDLWGSFSIDLRQLGLMVISGIALISSAMLLYNTFFSYTPSITPPAPWDWRLLFATEILSDAVIVVVAEELLFRGLLYRAFRLRYSIWASILFTTLIFTLVHTHYLRFPFQLGTVFLMGAVTAFLLERTHSISSSIVFHLAANATTISTAYYVTYLAP